MEKFRQTGTSCLAQRAEPFANVCVHDISRHRGDRAPLTAVGGFLVVPIEHCLILLVFPLLRWFGSRHRGGWEDALRNPDGFNAQPTDVPSPGGSVTFSGWPGVFVGKPARLPTRES